MTERLYYVDSYRRCFDAIVVRAFEYEGRPAVVLDRTAFYPTSGGQPFDQGRLDAVSVVDVVDTGDDVVHVLGSPVSEGMRVSAEVDWSRRFDHMQQHTGQHMLSAAFDRLFGHVTVGFHMGASVSTIDLAREATTDEIERAVDEANRIVWENRSVSVRLVSEEDATTLALRKETSRTGTLRVVEIPDFDLSACGGTHVNRTGAVGVIAALSCERLRGGSRISFACGRRALDVFRLYRDGVTESVRLLSVLPAELPAAVERAQLESRGLRKQAKALQERLAVHEAARLAASATDHGALGVVVQPVAGWDPAGLKTLAAAAAAARPMCVVLLSSEPPVSVAVACSAEVDIDASAVLKRLVDECGGRGGGTRHLAQGGGLSGPVERVVSIARATVASNIGR